MNLYYVTCDRAKLDAYDYFDAFIVVAATAEAAAKFAPHEQWEMTDQGAWDFQSAEATLVGTAVPGAIEGAIILSSFNAG